MSKRAEARARAAMRLARRRQLAIVRHRIECEQRRVWRAIVESGHAPTLPAPAPPTN